MATITDLMEVVTGLTPLLQLLHIPIQELHTPTDIQGIHTTTHSEDTVWVTVWPHSKLTMT